jgi:hypothetical protein
MVNSVHQKDRIEDRKMLHHTAIRWKHHGESAWAFEEFIRSRWPAVIERLGETEFQHLIAYVWKL